MKTYVFASLLLFAFASVPQFANAKGGDDDGAGVRKPCKNCKPKLGKIRVPKKPKKTKFKYTAKMSKAEKAKCRGKGRCGPCKNYYCPQGKGLCAGSCPKLDGLIKKVLGSNVACWSKLFQVEGGCSATSHHDPAKAHNPHEGVGLCAFEKSPAIRKQNGRGKICENLKTLEKQMLCCRAIMKKHGRAYFGTVGCGNVKRCS